MSSPLSQGLSNQAELAALAERIGAGDRAAEIELMVRWTPIVREIVRGRCRPGEPQLEDLLQDIMCKLLPRLRARGIRDLKSLPRYLGKMARNTCTAFYRREGTRLRMLVEWSSEQVDFDDPAHAAHLEQLRQLVSKLLGELRIPRDRELLLRYYVQDHTPERVCADLCIARDHFHRVTFRARRRMLVGLRSLGIDGQA